MPLCYPNPKRKSGKDLCFPILPLLKRPGAVEISLIREARAQEHERAKHKDELHIHYGDVQAERIGQGTHQHGAEEAEPLGNVT